MRSQRRSQNRRRVSHKTSRTSRRHTGGGKSKSSKSKGKRHAHKKRRSHRRR